jgi:hypothetical protein
VKVVSVPPNQMVRAWQNRAFTVDHDGHFIGLRAFVCAMTTRRSHGPR